MSLPDGRVLTIGSAPLHSAGANSTAGMLFVIDGGPTPSVGRWVHVW